MRKLSSWLKKKITDAETLSNLISFVCSCGIVFGALCIVGFTKGIVVGTQELNTTRERSIIVSVSQFVSAPIPDAIIEPTPIPEKKIVPDVEPVVDIAPIPEPEVIIAPPILEKPKSPPVEKKKEEIAKPMVEETVSVPNAAQIIAEEEQIAASRQTFYGTLAEAIHNKKFYSKAARRLELVGTVYVIVNISKEGIIDRCELHPDNTAPRILKKNALEIMERVVTDFKLEVSIENALPIEFVVPIEFNLMK